MSQNFCVFEWKSGSNRRRVEVFDRRIIGNNYAHTHTHGISWARVVGELVDGFVPGKERRTKSDRKGRKRSGRHPTVANIICDFCLLRRRVSLNSTGSGKGEA